MPLAFSSILRMMSDQVRALIVESLTETTPRTDQKTTEILRQKPANISKRVAGECRAAWRSRIIQKANFQNEKT